MPQPHKNLSRLSYNELHDLLDRSPILEGLQAEAFANALQDVPLYQNEARLQMVHSKAVLTRMEVAEGFEEALILSHVQETVPCFYLSLTLRQLFARGLVVAASKNATPSVLKKAVTRVYELPSFNSCPVLQRCAAELLLEGVVACETEENAQYFLSQFSKLPGIAYSPELADLHEEAKKQAKRAGRDPIVKIDLNQRLALPVKVVRRLFRMRDYRMKVELRGLEYYDQAVVRVPASNEKAARRAAEDFIRSFLKEQSGQNKSAKILDVFPPGSTWESGRHPVLKLK